MSAAGEPIGIVLAGGAGRRLGGAKPGARLGGRPLLGWAVGALRTVCDEVAVVAKPATALPELPEPIPVWHEPAEPVHPLAGIVWALQRSAGRPVLCCPVDVPFVSGASLRRLCEVTGAVVVADGQPLLGRFGSPALAPLQLAVREGRSARAAVAGLSPAVVRLPAGELFNVNTPEDLAAAEARLASRR
jgi:molybdenum cofactor guanylyltransferase